MQVARKCLQNPGRFIPGFDAEPLGNFAWCYGNGANRRCISGDPPSEAAVRSFYVQLVGGVSEGSVSYSSNTITVRGTNGGGEFQSLAITRQVMPSGGWQPWENANPYRPTVEVSNADLGQLVKVHPSVVNAILIDPETGAPLRTGELVAALNRIRAALEAAAGLPAGEDVSPAPDLAETQPLESEWPVFCGWAGKVCDFIDWVRAEPQEQEPPEVPWDETPVQEVNWSSGLGGGACPAPVSVSVSLGGNTATPEFSFEPICSFAGYMRPVVIALATILGVMILAGLRSSKDA